MIIPYLINLNEKVFNQGREKKKKKKKRNVSLSFNLHHRLIGLVGGVFTNGPGDLGLIPGRIIPKTLKMVLDASLLNTQQYKVRIKG